MLNSCALFLALLGFACCDFPPSVRTENRRTFNKHKKTKKPKQTCSFFFCDFISQRLSCKCKVLRNVYLDVGNVMLRGRRVTQPCSWSQAMQDVGMRTLSSGLCNSTDGSAGEFPSTSFNLTPPSRTVGECLHQTQQRWNSTCDFHTPNFNNTKSFSLNIKIVRLCHVSYKNTDTHTVCGPGASFCF